MSIGANSANSFVESLATYYQQVQHHLSQLDLEQVSGTIETLLKANHREATIFIFGNGGSASTASHFANDLAKGCAVEGYNRFRVISLVDNLALVTAWANDVAYEEVFAEQLKNLLRPGDVVIGISGSGNSPNILKGIEFARSAGAYTIGFCGYGGGKLRQLVDLAVSSDCSVMEQVEDIHMCLCHSIATTIRQTLISQQNQFELPVPRNFRLPQPTFII